MAAALIDYLPDAPPEAAGRHHAVAPSAGNFRTWPTVGRSDFTGTIIFAREIFEAPAANPSLLLKAKIVKALEKRTEIDTDITYRCWASTFQPKPSVAYRSDPEICRLLNQFFFHFRETISGLKLLNDPVSLSTSKTFDAIQALYLSNNRPRDRQIAERITELHRVVLEEGEHIMPASIEQFADFFLKHPTLNFPRIFVTPNGTLRARWIQSPENFVAIEFTGKPRVRMVAELPRDGETAAYFVSEPITSVVAYSRAIGASFE
jgi:hypothetical protein